MTTKYEKVGLAIDEYDKLVQRALTRLNSMCKISVGWLSGTAVLVAAGALFSNLAPLVSGIGLGTIVPAVRGKDVVTTMFNYYAQKNLLEKSVTKLRTSHIICSVNNTAKLEEIGNMISTNLDNLDYSKFKAPTS